VLVVRVKHLAASKTLRHNTVRAWARDKALYRLLQFELRHAQLVSLLADHLQ
jgi:hypothetical protein